MTPLSSASLAASYGPTGSSTASMVSALALLIPVIALGLLMAASPQVRAQLVRFRKECREFLYGPEKKPKKASPSIAATASADEPAPEAGAAGTTASKPEILSFDHSIFDEVDEE